ncbi:MAG: ParB/RepB/Spo0J family partition protein [Halothiobacillaceae bacterium]
MMDGNSDSPQSTAQAIQHIQIDQITPDPKQPRRHFDEEKLDNLATAIVQMGLLQPLLVREEEDKFIIVDGERRWRAAKRAGLKDVPVVFSKQAEARVLLAQVIANENRENLTDIELAKVIDTIKREYKITGRELGKLLNRNDAQISRLMLLVKNPEIQQLAEDGIITCAEHAALFTALDAKTQAELVANARDSQTALSYQDLTTRKDKPEMVSVESGMNPVSGTEPNDEGAQVADDLRVDHEPISESMGDQLEDCDEQFLEDAPRDDNHNTPRPKASGEKNSAATKDLGSLTLDPEKFLQLCDDDSSFIEALTSITLKAPTDLIAQLSERCSVT